MTDATTITPESAALAWNDEYERQGIPSSHRNEPSGVVLWALDNLRHVASRKLRTAIDLGCGTGRNSLALSARGFSVTGIDFAERALAAAQGREGAERVTFIQGDLTAPLPVESGSQDLAIDVFVYFHQLGDAERKAYREEIYRVLSPDGVLLVSLATKKDGYYANCSRLAPKEFGSSIDLRWDPEAGVGNILLTSEQFIAEFSDLFDLQMTWQKSKPGRMHSKDYQRFTVAALWQPKPRSTCAVRLQPGG
jgi:SAM-dependent methyltransferase